MDLPVLNQLEKIYPNQDNGAQAISKLVRNQNLIEQGIKDAQLIEGPQGPQGEIGPQGNTPFIGVNGNWWIGEDDTGISADAAISVQELQEQINVLNNKNLLATALNKCNNSQSCKIVCYGDSVTNGIGTTIPYPSLLQNNITKVFNNESITVVNKGTPNWDTNTAKTYLQTQVLDLAPDICFIMFGINDCRGTQGSVVPISTYYDNLKYLCNTLNTNNIAVVLMTPPPDIEEICRYKLASYADVVRELSTKLGVKLVDVNKYIWETYEKGIYSPYVNIPDSIHVDLTGHIVMASRIITDVFGLSTLQEGFLPLVNTHLCQTDITNIWTDVSLARGATYYFSGTNTNKIYIPFFCNKSSMDVYIETVLYNDGASYNVRVDGEIKAEVNTYQATLSPNELKEICSVGYGMHYLEIFGADKTTTSAGNMFHISAIKLV